MPFPFARQRLVMKPGNLTQPRWTGDRRNVNLATPDAPVHGLYMARVNGLIGFYFRDTLELTTIVPEKQYSKKLVKLDKFGSPVMFLGNPVSNTSALGGTFAAPGAPASWTFGASGNFFVFR